MPAPDEPEEKNLATPPGLRMTIFFLWMVIIVALIPFGGLVIATAGSFFAFGWMMDSYPHGLAGSLLLLVALIILAAIILGAFWLTMQLENRTVGKLPRHPARLICLPPLGIIFVAAAVAVTSWVPSVFFHDVSRSFPWPLVWAALGIGAYKLYRHLDRTLPK